MSIFLRLRFLLAVWIIGWGLVAYSPDALAQMERVQEQAAPEGPEEKSVEVVSVAADTDIEDRLTRIMNATGWFTDVRVNVDEGVAFLGGTAKESEHREWAARLARNTQDVVAVVNRIELAKVPVWDLRPIRSELEQGVRLLSHRLPDLLFAVMIMAFTFAGIFLTQMIGTRLLWRRMRNLILRQIVAKLVMTVIFVLGAYFALKVLGLTRLAATLLGGTGLVGLAIGLAFRDIAENFLASLLISLQHPFEKGDLIKVADHMGFVQFVNTRVTVLMTLEGNHVQIPNATIYKATITNITANPRQQLNFAVGIGYDASIAAAQKIGMRVMCAHPAVIQEPEPLVLVEKLGTATVNLRFYYWINARDYNVLKVQSAVMRQVKNAFQCENISMPDESREIVFPDGVPVTMVSPETPNKPAASPAKVGTQEDARTSNEAEGDLGSDASEIEAQARSSRRPEQGADLLE